MNGRKEEIRREDKKYSGKFKLILFCCALMGCLLGFVIVKTWSLDPEAMKKISTVVVPAIGCAVVWLCVLTQWISGFVFKRKSIQVVEAAADKDDEAKEAAQDAVEKPMNALLSFSALSCSIGFTGVGLAVTAAQSEEISTSGRLAFVGSTAGLIMLLVLVTHYQKWGVNFIKELNPEKRGSVYQMDFNKTWVSSCDEAEKLQIYHAGYVAYRVAFYTCLALWLVSVLGVMSGWMSWITVLFVGIIWTAMQAGYLYTASKNYGNNKIIAF